MSWRCPLPMPTEEHVVDSSILYWLVSGNCWLLAPVTVSIAKYTQGHHAGHDKTEHVYTSQDEQLILSGQTWCRVTEWS